MAKISLKKATAKAPTIDFTQYINYSALDLCGYIADFLDSRVNRTSDESTSIAIFEVTNAKTDKVIGHSIVFDNDLIYLPFHILYISDKKDLYIMYNGDNAIFPYKNIELIPFPFKDFLISVEKAVPEYFKECLNVRWEYVVEEVYQILLGVGKDAIDDIEKMEDRLPKRVGKVLPFSDNRKSTNE